MSARSADPPPLTRTTATTLSLLLTILYIGIHYFHPLTRPSPSLQLNSPRVIRARSRIALLATLLSLLLTALTLHAHALPLPLTIRTLGIWPITLPTTLSILRALLLIIILFAAPLAARVLDPDWQGVVLEARAAVSFWPAWRNHISAPFTEEVVFRACLIALHLHAGCSARELVFLTPLYFGVAHLHRLWEYWLAGRGGMLVGVVTSVVQFAYTTVFGWVAAFVFVRTGSVWASVAVHAFCNWMGLPGLGVGEGWGRGLYWAGLVGGLVGFWRCLWWATESQGELVRF